MVLTKDDGASRLLQVLLSSFDFDQHYEDSKHKSEICRAAFQSSSQCKFKADCDFAHKIHELRPRVFDFDNFKQQKCSNWAHGCQYSTRCLYIHDEKKHEISSRMVLLHSSKERKFRIVRDQGDGTVCVFTLHTDGKPKDQTGKNLINALWAFIKGKYGDIKVNRDGKHKCVVITSKNSGEIVKKIPIQKMSMKKFNQKQEFVEKKDKIQISEIQPTRYQYMSPSPPMEPQKAVELPKPVQQFTRIPPPGFSPVDNIPTQQQYCVRRNPMRAHSPPLGNCSELDHNAPPYIPGQQWTGGHVHPLPIYHQPLPPTYAKNPYAKQNDIFVHDPDYWSPSYHQSWSRVDYSPPPMPAQYYSTMIRNNQVGSYSSASPNNEPANASLPPPLLPDSGVLMPPRLPSPGGISPVSTPQKKLPWDNVDQNDQKESSISPASLHATSPNSRQPLRRQTTSPLSSAPSRAEDHKTPERPIKQGVFDPFGKEMKGTKDLLRVISDFQKTLGSQSEHIRALEDENARLRFQSDKHVG